MKARSRHITTDAPKELGIADALDLERIRESLRANCDFGPNVKLDEVTLERLWAGRRGRVTMEFALTLSVAGVKTRQLLQAGYDGAVVGKASKEAAIPQDRWIDNVSLSAPELGLTFVSPARDATLASPRDVACSVASQLNGGRLGVDIHDETESADEFDLVSYRVNKRFVIRTRSFDRRGNRTFIKALRRPVLYEALQFWQRAARRISSCTSGRVGFPRIIAVDPNRRWYAIEGKENGARCFDYAERDCFEAARLLTTIHQLPPCPIREHSVFDEIEILNRWMPVMHALGRSDAELMGQVVADLATCADRLDPAPKVLVHRDFHASQLLAEGERTWLLDYDTFAAGDPEVDVATYVAHWALDRVVAGDSPSRVADGLPAFVESYQSMGGSIDAEYLRLYVASALARMAVIHGFRKLDEAQVASIWAIVLNVVQERESRLPDARFRRRLAI